MYQPRQGTINYKMISVDNFLYVCSNDGLCVCVMECPPLQALQRFYDTVMQAVLRHVRFDVVKCILVASPGFVKVSCPTQLSLFLSTHRDLHTHIIISSTIITSYCASCHQQVFHTRVVT